MTARANTAGQRTCVSDRQRSEEKFGEFWLSLVKYVACIFLCYLKMFPMLLDINFESYCTYFALKVPWPLLALLLLSLI